MSTILRSDIHNTLITPEAWRDVISVAQDAIYVLDCNGMFLDVNPKLCSIFRLPREKLIGMSVTTGLDRDYVAMSRRTLHEIVEKRKPLRSTRCYTHGGGEQQVLETIETPLIREGEVWGIAGIARDITEEVSLEKKLWDTAEDEQSALDFSLRTSLGLVKGYIYTLGETEAIDAEQWYRYIQIIEEEIDHLTYTIEGVLDYRHIEQSNHDVDGEVVDLNECVQMVLSQLVDEASRREIQLIADVPRKIDPIFISRDGLYRILINLIMSSIHRTMHSGRITVSLVDSEEYIDITVSDNGMPIPEGELPYVFEKYFRGKDKSMTTEQSPGMGLAITRMLVTALGGKIWASSNAMEGNAFHVMLPRRVMTSEGNDDIHTDGPRSV